MNPLDTTELNLLHKNLNFEIIDDSSRIDSFLLSANSFSVFHINARSINSLQKRSSFDEMLFIELQCRFDVIVVSETWFSNDSDCHLIQGYKIFSVIRARRGGGVSIYVKDGLQAQKLQEYSWSTNDYDILSVKIEDYLIIGVYRQPRGNMNLFIDRISDILDMISDLQTSNSIVIGEFNIDLNSDLHASNRLLNLMTSHSYFNTIFDSTRISNEGGSLIDLCLTNINDMNSTINIAILVNDFSDPLPIAMTIKKKVFKPTARKLK